LKITHKFVLGQQAPLWKL